MKIVEGNEYFFWCYNSSVKKECLSLGTLYKCDKCEKLASVNSVWVMSGVGFDAVEIANKIKSAHGEITELGYSEEDDSNTCESCYCAKPMVG